MGTTRIMAILNVTPDSCYDGGLYLSPEKAIERGKELMLQGADMIDVGAESTRPGAEPVTEEEELQRLLPVLRGLIAEVTLPLSIDTYKWRIAQIAIEEGVTFLNDVTGFSDPSMRHLAAESGVEICLMHMHGTFKTMQLAPTYPDGLMAHLTNWFSQQVELLLQAGVAQEKIYLDPGFGFGKTVAHNMEILHNLPELQKLGFPLLLGHSRKSFLGKSLGKRYPELLYETLVVSSLACLGGVDWLRVHDVVEHRAISDFVDLYQGYSREHCG